MIDVACAVIHHKGDIVIAKRGPGRDEGLWEFPGGKREPNETIEECAIREIKEEIGVHIVPKEVLFTKVEDVPGKGVFKLHYIKCESELWNPVLSEHSIVRLCKAKNLKKYQYVPGDKVFVKNQFDWLEFEDARSFIRSIRIQNTKQWRKWVTSNNRNYRVPAQPGIHYKNNGWVSWYDWFGTSPKSEHWLPFIEARDYAQSLNLLNKKTWNEWAKSDNRPEEMPYRPEVVYKDSGWLSFGDWLGTGNISTNPYGSSPNQFLEFEEAKKIIQPFMLTKKLEYISLSKSHNFPKRLPKDPKKAYAHKWKGWRNFLIDWDMRGITDSA